MLGLPPSRHSHTSSSIGSPLPSSRSGVSWQFPSKKTDEALVDYLNREELQALLDAPDPTTRSGTRDRAMLHVCFAAGLRVSELIGLRLDDVQTHPQASIRVRGKGRRERVLPLWKETAKVLRAWLALRATEPRFGTVSECSRQPDDSIRLRVHPRETRQSEQPPSAHQSLPSEYRPMCFATLARCTRFRPLMMFAKSPCGWDTPA